MSAREQNINPDRYQLIPRTLIFATRSGQLLLIQGSPSKRTWANLYNGIGGHVEKGEDIFNAARREFFEETGLTLNALWLCGVAVIDTGEVPGVSLYIFRGEISDGKPVSRVEGELIWIPTNANISKFPIVADLTILLPKVLAYTPGQPIFSALYSYSPDGELRVKFAA